MSAADKYRRLWTSVLNVWTCTSPNYVRADSVRPGTAMIYLVDDGLMIGTSHGAKGGKVHCTTIYMHDAQINPYADVVPLPVGGWADRHIAWIEG